MRPLGVAYRSKGDGDLVKTLDGNLEDTSM